MFIIEKERIIMKINNDDGIYEILIKLFQDI